MQLRQVEYVLAVAEELSFTRAAKRFFISQAALSMQIKALERELGTRLFERDRHHVELTPAGSMFVEYARDILIRTNDVVQKIRDAEQPATGELRMGYIKGYEQSGLSNMLSRFHRKHPRVRVSLVRDDVTPLYDALRAEKLDVVINVRYPESDLANIECQRIRSYPLVAALSYEHPLASRPFVTLKDLSGLPIVQHDTSCSAYGEAGRIEQVAKGADLYRNVSGSFADIETSILCVLAGLGYALLPGYYTDKLHSDSRVVAVPIEGFEHEVEVVAAWLPNTSNEYIDVFLDEFLDVE